MPFGSRSSELFRDQLLGVPRGHAPGYSASAGVTSGLARDSTLVRHGRAPSRSFLGHGVDLDQQMAQEVNRAVLSRQQEQSQDRGLQLEKLPRREGGEGLERSGEGRQDLIRESQQGQAGLGLGGLNEGRLEPMSRTQAGSRERVAENMQVMEEIEQAIRRRKGPASHATQEDRLA